MMAHLHLSTFEVHDDRNEMKAGLPEREMSRGSITWYRDIIK